MPLVHSLQINEGKKSLFHRSPNFETQSLSSIFARIHYEHPHEQPQPLSEILQQMSRKISYRHIHKNSPYSLL